MKFEYDFSEFNKFAQRLSNVATFEAQMKKLAKEIAKALLKHMTSLTPVDDGTLIDGWNGNKFAVKKHGDSFEVLIVNKTPYALYVNDGHKAYNQYGGPYPIKHRVKVLSPYQWQTGDATWYVFGHFFVERGIVRLRETDEIETIIMKELQKWWDSV